MSTRYVWGRYELQNVWQLTKTGSIYYAGEGRGEAVLAGTGYSISPSGVPSLTGTETIWNNNVESSPYDKAYARFYTQPDKKVYKKPDGAGTSFWDNHQFLYLKEAGQNIYYDVMEPQQIPAKGSLLGTVSSSSPSAYPQNGMSGSYWYEYQGEDNVDPTGVDYVSPAKSARIRPYSVFATRSPTGRLLSISTKPPTPSNPSFRVLMASTASLTFAIR